MSLNVLCIISVELYILNMSLSVLTVQESMNGTFMSEAAALRVRCSRQQNS